MKRLFLPCFLLPAALFAAEVSTDDAARAAAAWVDRGYAMGKLPASRAVAAVDEVEDPDSGARLLVAKFDGGGFVVLSADDLVDPVLAFSETGDGLDPDENNPFWSLLRGDIAAREAAAGVDRGSTAKGGAATRGASARRSREPTAAQRKWAALLGDEGSNLQKSGTLSAPSDLRVDSFVATRWNQSTVYTSGTTYDCYNYYTPNHYVCGCVATALSQTMRYFGMPTSSVAAATYACAVDNVATDMTMKGGTYDWAAMPAEPWVPGTTEAQREAIGKLVYDVGVAVGMNWRSGGSSASIYTGQTALTADFGYAQAVALAYQDDSPYDYYPWSLETFKQVVVPCLDARTPVGLSISRPPTGGGTARPGHAVLADGYGYSDGDFYIHVNFGWGSSGDSETAWYCPPDLATDSSHPYDTIEGILCNVFPDKTGNIFSGRVLDQSLAPVAGAAVSFSDGQTAVSDANGVYAFVAPPGFYTATASQGSASGFVSGELTETVSLRTLERTSSYLYTRNKCGNSGNNDIVLSGLEATPAPVFDPGTCLFYPSTNVTIACSDAGATIRYTLDGSTPTESSPVYTGPIFVEDDVTIKARAFTAGKNPSPVVAAIYTYDAAQGAPKGDYFADPIKISGMNGSRVIEDNSEYTLEAGEPLHTLQNNSYSSQFSSIWYQWTAPGSGTMIFKTACSGGGYRYPTFVAIYTGETITTATRLAFSKTRDSNYATTLTFEVEQGATYRIAGVMGYDGSGTFTLTWSGDLTVAKTPYETWADANVDGGAPDEITGGVANAFRYVFGKPTEPFSPILAAEPGPSGNSVLRLPAIANGQGIALKVLSTTNLLDWTSAVETDVLVGQDGTVSLPFGGTKRFFRLKAEWE